MPYVTLRYERAKLYEEVWIEAVTTVAKRYGISDVALRKICRKLAVPLPPLGYWAKIAAGKKLPTPSLPKHSGPVELVRQRFVSDEPVEPDPEHLVARREFEVQPQNRIVVAETLDRPHALVVATERAFRKSKRRNPGDQPITEWPVLAISVSEASLPRALRIMDALIKALDARRMPLRIEPDDKRRTCLTIEGQVIAIRLAENISRTEREPTEKERQEIKKYGSTYLRDRYSFHHTGMLKLGILGDYRDELQKVVSDGKQQRIEQLLNEFVVKIETEAVRRKRDEEHRERQRLRWEEEARLRSEYEEKQRKEMERFKALETAARNWKRAEDLRAYIAAVEAKAAREDGSVALESELGRWLAWARQKAYWIDPILNTERPELDEDECPVLDEE